MNQTEMAQYFIDEFTEHKSKVVSIDVPKEILAVTIHLDDGKSVEVDGKFAADIKHALEA